MSKAIQSTIDELELKIQNKLKRDFEVNQRLEAKIQKNVQEKRELKRKLQDANVQLQAAQALLTSAKVDVAAWKERVAEVDAKEKAATLAAAFSAFKEKVSREIPDDKVKGKFMSFFQRDFLSWCADLAGGDSKLGPLKLGAPERDQLLGTGIINNSQAYLSQPQDLQFDINVTDGRNSFILLQATLAKALCDAFLTNPYFLAKEQRSLKDLETKLSRGSTAASVDWRIHTVKCLENIAPYDTRLSMSKAESFLNQFEFLLEEKEIREEMKKKEAREDLAQLFTDFAHLALELWKIPTNISVSGMPHFASKTFDSKSREMERLISIDGNLDGRPIGVVVLPLITSKPVVPEGKPQQRVVWSKAAVWVSGQK